MSSPLIGTVSLHPRGFGFVTEASSTPPRRAFVAPPMLNTFLDGDEVSTEIVAAADGRLTAQSLQLLKRSRRMGVGEVVKNSYGTFIKLDALIGNTIWPLTGADAIPAGTLVRVVLDDTQKTFASPLILDGKHADEERILARHDIDGGEDIEVSRHDDPHRALRRDVRALPFVTIDGPSTKDIDDAVFAHPPDADGGIRLLVAIADVDAAVPEGSAIDVAARHRGTSVYLPGRVVPMLPRALSEDRLSLLPHVERAVMIAELRIDQDGITTAVDLYEALMTSHARLTYDDVAAFLTVGTRPDQADWTATTEAVLSTLQAASARLSQARAQRGGLDHDTDEATIQLDAQGQPVGIAFHAQNIANTLIERLMVAANEAVADFLHRRAQPCLFRVHPYPTAERSLALEEVTKTMGVVAGFATKRAVTPTAVAALVRQVEGTRHQAPMTMALRRLLGPARYDASAGPHFGLASPLYAHFTSPIRRYADLCVHRAVRHHLHGVRDDSAHDPAWATMATHLNHRSHHAARAEDDRARQLAAAHYATRIGEAVAGYVTGVKGDGVLVQLPGAMAFLPEVLPLGSQVHAVIDKVDTILGHLDLRRADPPIATAPPAR
jgi:ribonuclease R